MAQLKVFLNGQFVSQHGLTPGRELAVGRGEGSDVVLNPERGISRQHFRLRFAEGQWIVEVLSRYGELYRNGEKQTVFGLRNGTTFTVPPYEFVFEDEGEGEVASQGHENAYAGEAGEDDKTQVGYLPSVAYLRLTDHRSQPVQTYRLEGVAWIAGRDTSCSIFIDNPKISRRQFEMQKQDDVYFIRDLGGVNGTLLNGRPISTEDWLPLASSDTITIADWNLQFELRDADYEQRLQEIDPAVLVPVDNYQDPGAAHVHEQPQFQPEAEYGSQGFAQVAPDLGGADLYPPPAARPGMRLFGRHIPGLNPVRLALIVIVLGAGLYAVLGDNVMNPGPAPEAQNAKPQSPFDKLPPEKQQMVKQLYMTAQSLVAQGRYELARQEIIKLHQIIPYYEDSKQIEEVANQGLAMLAEREKAEAEERQRAQVEEKIQKQVAECKAQITPESELSWLETCLSPVLEFNPEHPSIQALRAEVNRLTEERSLKLAQQKDYAEKVGRLRALFNKAQKVEKEAPPLTAITAYEHVVKSHLPDPHKLIPAARRQIASIQDAMVSRQAEAEKKADTAFHAGQIKQAVLILREGLRINPDNEVLKGKHLQYMGDLRKQMMNFYQEGILEESVGEVETAKVKWRKIIDQSLPGEDYFEKAKIKLKKYGAL